MNTKWIGAIIVVIVIIVAAAAAIVMTNNNDNGGGDNGDGTITVTDGIGRTVTLSNIETVSSCSNVVASILCGIGASESIVASSVDEGAFNDFDFVIGLVNDDYPQAIIDGLADGSIQSLGGMYNMSAESAMSVESDLKIFTEYGYDPDTGAALDTLGVQYIVLKNEDSIETVYDNIALLGKIMNRESAADELVSEMKDVVSKIKNWCASVSQGTEISAATFIGSNYACGDLYIKGAILKDLGATNPFSDLGKYAQVSSEAIAEKDPSVLIYTNVSMGSGESSSSFYDEFMSDPVLGSTTAALNNNVYVIDGEKTDNATCTNSHEMLNAYALWAMCIYSDYLPFEVPNIITDDVFEDLINQFWEVVNSEDTGTITVTDGLGRTVTLSNIETVSSCSNVVASILCGIGASESIVAVSYDDGSYEDFGTIFGLGDSDYPKAIIDGLNSGKIKSLGGMYNMSAESAMSVESDLKIFTEYGYDANTGAALDSVGIPYIVLKNESSINTVYDNITLLGKVMGKEAEANQLVNEMKNVVQKVKDWCSSVSGDDVVTGSIVIGSDYACGDQYIKGTILEDLGAVNVFAENGKYAQVSKEAIAQKNPGTMIYTSVTMGSDVDPATFIKDFIEDPVLGGIDAAKNNKVYVINGEKTDGATSTNSQEMLNAYAFMSMCLYSDYLPFDVPNTFTDDVFEDLLDQFWKVVNT